jgi:uncharacterized membrane protein (UPF0127 family)
MGRFTGMSVLALRTPNGGALAAFVAERYPQRLLGLAGLGALPPGTGLLIPRCRAVHTFGMRFPLDVLFVSIAPRFLEVVELRAPVRPRRLARAARAGVGALEISAGGARRLGLAPGLGLCAADHAW